MKKAAVDCAGQPDTFRFRRDTSRERWQVADKTFNQATKLVVNSAPVTVASESRSGVDPD